MAKRDNKTKLSTNKKKHKASRPSKSFKKSRATAVNMSSGFQPGGRRETKKGSSGVKDEDVLENKASSINHNSGAAQQGSSLSKVRKFSSPDDGLSAFSAWMPMGHAINILRFDEEDDEYVIKAEGKDKIHKVSPDYILYWVSARELERFERYGSLYEESSDEQSSDSESESDIENIPSPTIRSRQAWTTQRAIEEEKSRQRMKRKHERSLINARVKQEIKA